MIYNIEKKAKKTIYFQRTELFCRFFVENKFNNNIIIEKF